jgi:uncharacterized cupredoxin-like copper-binding protein
MHSNRFARLLVLLALGSALVASLACGSGGDKVKPEPDPEHEGPAEAGVVHTPPPGAATVNVALSESILAPDVATVLAGQIYLLANNIGGEAHEVVVVKTDLAEDALPVKGGHVDEDKIDVIGEVEQFAPGSKASGVFDLEPGKYVLICNVAGEDGAEGHYQKGMHAAFTVQ